jgi:hypothetical protein
MKKKFFLLLLFVGCGLINSKEEWVEMTKRENKIKNIYAKIQSEQSEIDNLINKKHPSLKRDRKNNIIRPDGITLSGKPVYYKSYHGKS